MLETHREQSLRKPFSLSFGKCVLRCTTVVDVARKCTWKGKKEEESIGLIIDLLLRGLWSCSRQSTTHLSIVARPRVVWLERDAWVLCRALGSVAQHQRFVDRQRNYTKAAPLGHLLLIGLAFFFLVICVRSSASN